MAESDDKAPTVPWLPLITLIGVGSGVFLFFPQLTNSRPGGGDPRLAKNTFDDQTIDARLWQDPLGVAIADREKSQKHAGPHSVDRFQELLVKKCYEGPAICPLNRELLFAQLAKRIRILAVMIPGGPYVEDVERRLRSRRAVIEGLELAGYDPERDHEIGYFCVHGGPLAPTPALVLPRWRRIETKTKGVGSQKIPGFSRLGLTGKSRIHRTHRIHIALPFLTNGLNQRLLPLREIPFHMYW